MTRLAALVVAVLGIGCGDRKEAPPTDYQVLTHREALLAAKKLGQPGARDLTAEEIADTRARCAKCGSFCAEICASIARALAPAAKPSP